jgi:branched-subunit amino acid transport protein
MNSPYLWLAVLALGAVTVITRGVFLLPRREPRLPKWLAGGLRHAPLAALMAVVVPEVVHAPATAAMPLWSDPRWFAVAASVGWYCWRRGITGAVIVGASTLVLFQSLARV